MPETIAFAAAYVATSVSAAGAAGTAAATAASFIPVVGAAGAAAASVAATTLVTSLLSSVAIAALQVGIQALIAPNRSANFDRGSTVREATFADPTRRRFFGLGEIKTGGALAFWQPASDGSLWRVVVFDCQSTESIIQHFLNNEPVTLDADGWVQEPAKWQDTIRILTRFGKSSGSEQPHRYWRVIDTAASATDYGAYAEVEFRTTAGGADIATGGTALAGSAGDSTAAADAFDGSASTFWRGAAGSIAAGTSWVGYDLGSGNDAVVRQVALTAPGSGDPDWASVALLVQGSHADGSTTFTDRSPVGRTLTNVGCAWSSAVQIGGENAIRVDLGDAISAADASDLEPGAGGWSINVAAQVDIAAGDTFQIIAGKVNFTTGQRSWWLAVSKADARLFFAWSTDGSAGTVDLIEIGTITTNTPFVADVVIGADGTVTGYLDGVASADVGAVSGSIFGGTAPVVFGRNATGGDRMAGYLGPVRITNKPRSAVGDDGQFPEVLGSTGAASAFKVQFSDDGAAWWDAWSETGIAAYTDGETKTFTRSGMQEALPELIEAFDAWTYAHRGDGLSYVAIQQKQVAITDLSETYPRGATGEEWTAIRRADDQVWDPRDDSYGYSDNAALCLLRVLMHPDGGRLTADDFDLDAWEAAADACDATTTTPEGYEEVRYRVAGLWEAAGVGGQQSLYSAVEQMLFAMNAMVYQDPANGGKLGIVVDLPTANADGPLTSSDVLAIQISPAETYLDRYDATAVQWVSPAQGYADVVSPHYPFDLESPQRLRTLPGQMVPSHTQAARLAKLNHLRLSSPDAVTASLGPVGLLTREADRIAFDMIEAPEGLEIVVTEYDMGPTDSPSFSVSGWGIPSGYGAFDPAAEIEAEILPPALTVDGSTIAAPTGLVAGIDKDVATTFRVSWPSPEEPGLAVEYQIDIGQDGFETRRKVFPATSGYAELTIAPGAEALANVRARYIKLTGGATEWHQIDDVSLTTPVPAPTAPVVSVVGESLEVPLGGADAQINISIAWANGEGVYQIKVYADNGTNPPTTLLDTVQVASGDNPYTYLVSVFAVPTDVIYYKVEAVNISNNVTASTVGSGTVTQSAPE